MLLRERSEGGCSWEGKFFDSLASLADSLVSLLILETVGTGRSKSPVPCTQHFRLPPLSPCPAHLSPFPIAEYQASPTLPLKFLPLPALLELPLSHPFDTSRTPFLPNYPSPVLPDIAPCRTACNTWILLFSSTIVYLPLQKSFPNMLCVETVSLITFDFLCPAVPTDIDNISIKANEKHEHVTRFSSSGSFYINTSRLNQS